MNDETEKQILDVLKDIRDTHRETLQAILTQQQLVREQLEISRNTVAESVALQRLALKRQRTVSVIAFPAIIVCIAAILYLVVRYF